MEPAVCPGCHAEVWPEDEEQPHRDCDNCGTRVWFKEWAKERFGGSSIPRHAMPEFPSSQKPDNDDEDATNEELKDTSLDDYL